MKLNLDLLGNNNSRLKNTVAIQRALKNGCKNPYWNGEIIIHSKGSQDFDRQMDTTLNDPKLTGRRNPNYSLPIMCR